MPEIKALLGGSACDLGGGLRAEWEPGAIQVTFRTAAARKSATSVAASITFSRPVSRRRVITVGPEMPTPKMP